MNLLTVNELGEVIRKVRKERNLRLNDLADKNISQATISNIERGVPHVQADKVQYLLDKLEIADKLPELLISEKENLHNLLFQFFLLEAELKNRQLDQAEKRLKKLQVDDDHPYAGEFYYWKGRLHFAQQKWKRAERALYNAIRLANQSSQGKQRNIESLSFNKLSLCSFYQNDLEQALQFVKSGLDAFVEDVEEQQIKYIMIRNQALYLERMDRLAEGLKVIQDAWHLLPKIEQVETVLSFHWARSEMLRRSGLLTEAKKYAREGLQLAQLNLHYTSMFDHWTLLGSIYMGAQDWEKAEECFQVAIGMKDQVIYKENIATTCTRMGILYSSQNKWSLSEKMFKEAIQYGEQCYDTSRLVDALIAMGHLYLRQNNRQKAIFHFQRAITLAQKHHFRQKEYKAWFLLARAWEGKDEEEFITCMRNMYRTKTTIQEKEADILESFC